MRALHLSLGLALTPTALGQAFAGGGSQLPSNPAANNSPTENIDWADVDLDGDFDVLLAVGSNFNQQNHLWINQGGAQGGTMGFFKDETLSKYPAIADESRDVDFADIDGDGDPDALVSNTSGDTDQANQIIVNQGGLQGGTAGFFVNETSSRWVNLGVNDGVTTFSSIAPSLVLPTGGFIDHSGDTVLGDLDADGDMDLLHSTYGTSFAIGNVPHRIFLNDGLGFFEEHNPSGFQLGGAAIVNGDPALWAAGVQEHETTQSNGQASDIATAAVTVDLGDLDGDFDLDLVLGDLTEQPRLFRNELAGGVLLPFTDVTAVAFAQGATGFGVYEQEFGDVDNDQDLDLYGINWSSPFNDVLMLNDGAFGFGPFISIPSSTADDEEADFFDYDADGDLDVYVANFSGQDKLYANGGAPGYALVDATELLHRESKESMGVDSVDIDLDGDLDVMVAQREFTFPVNDLWINVTGTADTHAPRIVVEQVSGACGQAVMVRAHVFDNASWEWLRYNPTGLGISVDGGPFTTVPMDYAGGEIWRGEIPAGTVGAIAYRVRSMDSQGNVGLSPVLSYSTPSVQSYCTAGTSASGCAATLSSTGMPSVSAGSGFTVTASNVEGQKDGLYFYGFNGPQANSWGNGTSYQCVLPPVMRTPVMSGTGTAGQCNGGFTRDLCAYWATAAPAKVPAPGQQVNLQLWYRDPASTSNQTTSLSDGLQFTACP